MSIDFTLSEAQIADLSTNDGLVVPLSVLTKEPRRNFDLRDGGGAAVPVLGKNQNGELALIALMSAAVKALPTEVSPEAFQLLAADLRRVVFDAPNAAADALGYFISSAESGDRWRGCHLARREVSVAARRTVAELPTVRGDRTGHPHPAHLKYSYGEDFALDPDDQPLGEHCILADCSTKPGGPIKGASSLTARRRGGQPASTSR